MTELERARSESIRKARRRLDRSLAAGRYEDVSLDQLRELIAGPEEREATAQKRIEREFERRLFGVRNQQVPERWVV